MLKVDCVGRLMARRGVVAGGRAVMRMSEPGTVEVALDVEEGIEDDEVTEAERGTVVPSSVVRLTAAANDKDIAGAFVSVAGSAMVVPGDEPHDWYAGYGHQLILVVERSGVS